MGSVGDKTAAVCMSNPDTSGGVGQDIYRSEGIEEGRSGGSGFLLASSRFAVRAFPVWFL
jgi:hypothetical protein